MVSWKCWNSNWKKYKIFDKLSRFEEDLTSTKEPDSIKYIRNVFKLGKLNIIRDQMLEDIRSLFENEEDNY